jgi:hypothetical protein
LLQERFQQSFVKSNLATLYTNGDLLARHRKLQLHAAAATAVTNNSSDLPSRVKIHPTTISLLASTIDRGYQISGVSNDMILDGTPLDKIQS